MDIWQLHIFCKVIELESFSKAGAAVHISQPTVSSHIANLIRNKHRSMSPLGKVFTDYLKINIGK